MDHLLPKSILQRFCECIAAGDCGETWNTVIVVALILSAVFISAVAIVQGSPEWARRQAACLLVFWSLSLTGALITRLMM